MREKEECFIYQKLGDTLLFWFRCKGSCKKNAKKEKRKQREIVVLHREGKGVLGQARQVLMKCLFLLFSSSLSLLCSYEKINQGGFSFFNFLFFVWWFISLIFLFFFCLSHWMFLKSSILLVLIWYHPFCSSSSDDIYSVL